jgi:hypothetical protein
LEREEEVARKVETLRVHHKGAAREAEALLAHIRGVRQLDDGDPSAAAESFERADQAMAYWDSLGPAIFKLYNLGYLARALEQSGNLDRAEATWEKLEDVNPVFRAHLEAGERGAASG